MAAMKRIQQITSVQLLQERDRKRNRESERQRERERGRDTETARGRGHINYEREREIGQCSDKERQRERREREREREIVPASLCEPALISQRDGEKAVGQGKNMEKKEDSDTHRVIKLKPVPLPKLVSDYSGRQSCLSTHSPHRPLRSAASCEKSGQCCVTVSKAQSRQTFSQVEVSVPKISSISITAAAMATLIYCVSQKSRASPPPNVAFVPLTRGFDGVSVSSRTVNLLQGALSGSEGFLNPGRSAGGQRRWRQQANTVSQLCDISPPGVKTSVLGQSRTPTDQFWGWSARPPLSSGAPHSNPEFPNRARKTTRLSRQTSKNSKPPIQTAPPTGPMLSQRLEKTGTHFHGNDTRVTLQLPPFPKTRPLFKALTYLGQVELLSSFLCYNTPFPRNNCDTARPGSAERSATHTRIPSGEQERVLKLGGEGKLGRGGGCGSGSLRIPNANISPYSAVTLSKTATYFLCLGANSRLILNSLPGTTSRVHLFWDAHLGEHAYKRVT
ncbi:hypothetical protein JZ751_004333 [Albula glossodonta]|uniref:Uncharacterized protein n=1 Tax=Albula glossodonta TaxID=121402 RepID=A0A8T2NAA3_9TELE|nr:hypothetical protein JZ751_004333 [Albula glossodonta]